MVNQTQQNPTNPQLGWAFGFTFPNPGYGQSDTTELYQSLDRLEVWPYLIKP
jgi:hypothetical protein